MAHADLITRAELLAFGLDSDFLGQFDVVPIEVKISTAGALGTMEIEWRNAGETDWSPAVRSSVRAPWVYSPKPRSYAILTFAAGTYVASSIYTVDEAGTVTRSGGAIDTVTAERFDIVERAIDTVTARVVGKMQPRKETPITAWGADVKQAAFAWVRYLLKDAVGFAPSPASIGDMQIVEEKDNAIRFIDRIGSGAESPPDLVDSSAAGTGNGLKVRVSSDSLRGW